MEDREESIKSAKYFKESANLEATASGFLLYCSLTTKGQPATPSPAQNFPRGAVVNHESSLTAPSHSSVAHNRVF